MFPIKEVRDADIAFSSDLEGFIPSMDEIPEEFKQFNPNNKWLRVQADWFFCGITIVNIVPKPDVDVQKAMRHLAVIQRSLEPSHEHKEAAVAFLMSEWFEEFEYTVNKQDKTF